MKLFDDIERNSEEAADYGESAFSYINQTSRDNYARARDTFEEWFTRYSQEHPKEATDFRSRFRSEDDETHYSALTELYTFNLLTSNGFKTIAHPVLEGSTKRPDFLALKDGVPKFYTEATVIFGNPISTRINKFKASILDTVNQVNSPDFFISLNFKEIDAETPPPISKIKKFLQEKITSLDYDKVCKNYEDTSEFPEWEWKYNGWTIVFSVSPVSEEGRKVRDDNSRTIGIIQHPVQQINLDTSIKKGLLGKAKKYGKLGLPFLVVLNVIGDYNFCDDYTVMSALFGQETITFQMSPDGTELPARWGRNEDGVFINPKQGITYTRLSGALILSGLSLPNAETIKSTIWLHPKAEYPFEVGAIKNTRYKVHSKNTDKMEDLEL